MQARRAHGDAKLRPPRLLQKGKSSDPIPAAGRVCFFFLKRRTHCLFAESSCVSVVGLSSTSASQNIPKQRQMLSELQEKKSLNTITRLHTQKTTTMKSILQIWTLSSPIHTLSPEGHTDSTSSCTSSFTFRKPDRAAVGETRG